MTQTVKAMTIAMKQSTPADHGLTNGTVTSTHMKSFPRGWELFAGGVYDSLFLLFKRIPSDIVLQIHGQHYPTWCSLARNYLAIMASSVSSESAFSAAGITISKCRNRLEGNIIEALQCLKSLIHQDLLFHDVVSATQDEEDLDLADQDPANHEANTSEVVCDGDDWSWDKLVEGLEDEEEPAAVIVITV
jgi:hypothetical protein